MTCCSAGTFFFCATINGKEEALAGVGNCFEKREKKEAWVFVFGLVSRRVRKKKATRKERREPFVLVSI